MHDLRSFVWPVVKNVMRDRGFCGGFCRCESEWKKTFEKEADRIFTLCISFRSAQSELEATSTFTDTAKVKLFTAEKESSCKTAVSLDTHLVVIAGFGHHHLKYFIQDVDGNVFDRVIGHVRVSTHRSPKKEFYWVIAKVSNIFLLIDVCLVPLQRRHKSCFFCICRNKM